MNTPQFLVAEDLHGRYYVVEVLQDDDGAILGRQAVVLGSYPDRCVAIRVAGALAVTKAPKEVSDAEKIA